MRNALFWHFARRMLRRRLLAVGTLVFAVISAGGLAAVLVSLGPMLELILGGGNPGAQLTLPAIAESFSIMAGSLASGAVISACSSACLHEQLAECASFAT